MDLRRVRRWDWLTGLSGAALIGVMFLDWYRVDFHGGAVFGPGTRASANAWQAFSAIDVIMLIAGLAGIAVVVVTATQRTLAIPQTISTLSVIPALVAAILVVIRVVDPPGWTSIFSGGTAVPDQAVGGGGLNVDVTREAGVWLGLAAALTLLVACWRAMGDQRIPRVARSSVEVTRLPAPE